MKTFHRCALAAAIVTTIMPAANASEVIDLEADVETIVVTATGYEQMLIEAPASISVITRQELERKRFASIAEALADVEGIDIGQEVDKTGGLSISIRGMPSSYTLILIDGRRQNPAGNVTPNGFGGTASSFMPPLAAIERIEVIRGPMSTLYGSDAMGGVVNIITRKVGQQWAGAVSFNNTLQQHSEFGNSNGMNFYLNGPLLHERLGLVLRGSALNRAAADIRYTDQEGEEIVPWMGANPVKAEIYNLGTKLNWQISTNQLVSFDQDHVWQTYDNSLGQMGTLGSGGYEPKQKYNRQQSTLAYQGRFDIGFIDASLMHNSTETLGRIIPPGIAGAGEPRTLESDNTIADLKWVTAFGDHQLSVGGQWWRAEMTDAVAPAPFTQTMKSVFIEDNWRLHDDFSLTMGARYDHHDAFGSQLSPRLYGVWNPVERWTIKGGVSQGYKTPSIEMLTDGIYGFGAQGTLPFVGNPDLKPETSTTSELNVFYVADSGLSASAGAFINRFSDKLARGTARPNCTFPGNEGVAGCVDVGNWPTIVEFSQTTNVDKAETRGAELSLRIPLVEQWSWLINYTYTESEQKSGAQQGLPLTNTPKHMLNSNLRWQFTEQASVWLSNEYRSKRYRGAGAAYDALGDFKAYTLSHLGANYQVTETVTLSAVIYNLLDKDYLQYTPYANPTAANPDNVSYSNLYPINQEGRRLWLSANIQF
ncbi:TonB-dependent receptor [Alkalimonas collagenimarina]|uniref:TonB-dependent receptor n=1 Tax=Alkalimonas collagenimarina TaxID=400390 RepID=A0ABT9GZP3_9GAMM|nr:TonB-dependent receptor [Alkalimonas collagenimarina]MDP4536534.1 TonB-dependent receptor [Alkalimonas collagenimarina]